MAPAPSRETLGTAAAPSSRQVVLAVAVSLDGCIARTDGSVDWLVEDPTVDLRAYGKVFDTIVAGRKTLDLDQMRSGSGGGGWGKMSCYVFSRTRTPGKRGTAEYVNRAPGELVRELKAVPGKDIWLMGGGEVAREFLKEDLVDRMDVAIMPVLIGEGIPLFPPKVPQRNFRLLSHTAHPSGIIRAIYEKAAAAPSHKS